MEEPETVFAFAIDCENLTRKLIIYEGNFHGRREIFFKDYSSDEGRLNVNSSFSRLSTVEGIELGQDYKHFKGGRYNVLGVARDCEHLENLAVVYSAYEAKGEFPAGQIWVRSLEDFVGFKELEDGGRIKRFECVRS